MLNVFKKIIFSLKKPQIIVVVGNNRACTSEAIFRVLNQHFKVRKVKNKLRTFDLFQNKVLIFESKIKEAEPWESLVKKSRLPILVVTAIGEIPPEQEFFAADIEKVKEVTKLVEILPSFSFLVLNFDDETVRELKNKSSAQNFTFGFQERADFRATDIKLNRGTNFKINYKVNIVPAWLEKLFGKEQIYSALAVAVVGEILKLNLLKVSESLKNYKSLPGRMRLIEGIKNSWILDDSQSATAFSMIEALKILGEVQEFERKIAVLGDVIGIGKYTIEAHETIGEKVAASANLLFTIGARAKFIGEGAFTKGMAQEKIFQFDETERAVLALQNEIKEGDLILVDGSKEMEMEKIVEGIRKIE